MSSSGKVLPALTGAGLLLAGGLLGRLTAPSPPSRPTPGPAAPVSPAGPGPVPSSPSQPISGPASGPAFEPVGQDWPPGTTQAVVAGGVWLLGDGTKAHLQGEGAPKPLETGGPVPRVFAAAGRLWAYVEGRGAPVLHRIIEGQPAQVTPLPCRLLELTGSGDSLAGICEGRESLAQSQDGGRSFTALPVAFPPSPRAPEGSPAQLEAVGVEGASLWVAGVQRWAEAHGGQDLLWSLAQAGPRAGRGSRTVPVPGLVRTVALWPEGGGAWLWGLEVAPGDEEGVRARVFRSLEGYSFVPHGRPGPRCQPAHPGEVQAVLLGPREAAFLCQGQVFLSADGGESWSVEALPGPATSLGGGEGRVLARVEGRWLQRRLALRDAQGAVAVRVPKGPAPRLPVDAGDPGAVREPDGGQ